MTCKSSLPGHEYLQEAGPAAEIIVRLVEEAVSEPCAYDGGYQQCIEERIEEALLDFLAAEEPGEDVVTEYEP